jgi:hypothetical protein
MKRMVGSSESFLLEAEFGFGLSRRTSPLFSSATIGSARQSPFNLPITGNRRRRNEYAPIEW